MTIDLSFLSAVAIAGLAALLGESIVTHTPWLRQRVIPGPALGGLAFAAVFLALRAFDVRVDFPVSGRPVDFLVALLTTNMGLHITPKLLRGNYLLFPAFVGAGLVLFFIQFVLVLPVMLLEEHTLRMAILTGPVSFVGAPFNLNPPSQIPPIAEYFEPAIANPTRLAQANMMIGVIAGIFLAGIVGRHLFERASKESPKEQPTEQPARDTVWNISMKEFTLLLVILNIIAVAFWVQGLLLQQFAWMKQDYLPVIVISYLLGIGARLIFNSVFDAQRFPQQSLNVLLYGPTMSLVLAYSVMAIPLAQLAHVTIPMLVAAAIALGASAAVAWSAYSIFARITDHYYAAGIATVFLAVTTAWGAVAMSYLHRITEERGPVQPVPVALPLNAFFIFPWMASLLTILLLGAVS